jgi:hypothetical protein|uniref:Uncharacterized protein n=1 Tax=viral metagenome TaxID=1070528 RepID=A0A6C0ILB1_9ZZZZ
MSLITTASPWISSNTNENKKRVPSIRRNQKNDDDYTYNEPMQTMKKPSSIEDAEESNNKRNTKINELLNQMTDADNENDNLGEFSPIEPPAMQSKKDDEDDTTERLNQFIPEMPRFSHLKPAQAHENANKVRYGADDTKVTKLSNYNKIYEGMQNKQDATPYYSKMGIGSQLDDSRLMEKINYMIHLLEQQQHEKTDNITEEFLLYTFLGVFVVYVLDSFARSGKYVR